eukprot:scaffold4930_cov161-Prasinococcus_capsulatus_cf.AAC.1
MHGRAPPRAEAARKSKTRGRAPAIPAGYGRGTRRAGDDDARWGRGWPDGRERCRRRRDTPRRASSLSSSSSSSSAAAAAAAPCRRRRAA